MEQEKIRQNIGSATVSLLKMVRESCWNKISDNCLFILTEIQNDDHLDPSNGTKCRRANDKLVPVFLDEITDKLIVIYPELYDVNLYVHRANIEHTVVNVRFYSKKNLSDEYQGRLPMVHSKLALPSYIISGKKFDIHWKFGGVRHQWRHFWEKRAFYKSSSQPKNGT